MAKKEREADPKLEAEKKHLDALYREAPVVLGEPFNLTLDWFLDDRAGGSDFKTWAGQQSVFAIASGMKRLIGRDVQFAGGVAVPVHRRGLRSVQLRFGPRGQRVGSRLGIQY